MFTGVNYKSRLIGLADCNNFYASCERVFRPDLRTTPIAVLSNNDGCVIARSKELKSLGVKMGTPYYQIKDLVRTQGIKVFSSNYELYGDMSERVMTALSSYVEETEIYSIDECFLDFSGFTNYDLKAYGERIVYEVSKGTGIPLSLGIAPSKTLAKVANKFAKKYTGYRGSCIIDTPEKHLRALELTDIGDVWGIGRQHARKLAQFNVKTAKDFIQMPQSWVRREFTVVGERTWKELRGVPCDGLSLEEPPKQTICTSRAFGTMVSEKEGLREAISNFSALCASKLRKQNSCASGLIVFIHTNPFRKELPQYSRSITINLPVATSITTEIIKYALEGLNHIFREGYQYKKAGVILTGIIPAIAVQQNIFDTYDRKKHQLIMPVLDRLNNGFNRNILSLACQTGRQDWKMQQTFRSPCYTTRPKEFIHIKFG